MLGKSNSFEPNIRVTNYDGFDVKLEFGKFYAATGTCGMTEDKEVVGVFTKIDNWGIYLTNSKGVICLCNPKTVKIHY